MSDVETVFCWKFVTQQNMIHGSARNVFMYIVPQ